MTAPDSPDVVPPPPVDPPAVDPADQLELKLPDESAAWKDVGLWAGVLVLLSLVAYWPAVGGRFQWLDDRAVAENRALALPGGLGYVWQARWADPAHYRFATYQPVAFTVNWLAYRLGGHDDNNVPTPTAYHAASLLCHALGAVLAWLALRELLVPGAWLIAAVFALHPANAEAVSWVSDGGVPVGGLLFFGSIYAYLTYMGFRDRDAADRAAGGPGGDPAQTWGLYAVGVVCALLAPLAFPAAAAAFAVLLLALWWRRRLTPGDFFLIAPVLVVAAGLWLAGLGLPRPTTAVPAVAALPFGRIVALVGEAIGFATAKLLVPVHLSLLYSNTVAGGLTSLAIAAVAVGGAFAVARRGGPRGPAAALAAFALCAALSLNWFDPARRSQQVDPVTYLAAVPFVALVLAAVTAGVRRARPVALTHVQSVVIAASVVLVLLGFGTWVRAHAFVTPVDLWRNTADGNPTSAFAHAQLAEQQRLRAVDDAADQNVDAAKVDLSAAVASAARAVDLAGGDADTAAAAQRTWAASLAATGDFKAALPHYDAATAGDAGSGDARTLVDYGQALLTLGQPDQLRAAVTQLNRALLANPDYAPAHRVLGRVYGKLMDPARSLLETRLAVQRDPSDLLAQEQLAEMLADRGQLAEAMQHYVPVISNPANSTRADLWAAIARVKVRQDKLLEAVGYFRQAKALDPKLDVEKDLTAAEAALRREAATRPAVTRPATAPAVGDTAAGGLPPG